MGVWSDSDYDWGFNCVFGVADNEDLRARGPCVIHGAYNAFTCINTLSQPAPQCNTGNPITTLLTRNYTTGDTNFENFEIDFELWEEDCNGDCTYDPSGCFLGVDAAPTFQEPQGCINWRSNIPNLAPSNST